MKLNSKYDVIIFGGGTSGCCAAYMCAKGGLKTLLIEKNNCLGGLMTSGLVVPIMKSSSEDLNCTYYKKLIEKAKKYNAQITYKENGNSNDGWLNPEVLKIVLADLLSEDDIKKNLDILFEATIETVTKDENKILSVTISSNLLSIPIEARYYIDSTASAEFSFKAGCHFLEDNKICQQNSLRFIVGNVDIEKFADFILKADSDRNITNTYRNDIDTNNQIMLTTASTWDENKTWALDKYLKEGVKEGILNDNDRAYFQLFSIAGSQSQIAFNCPRINNYNDDLIQNSNELINGYKAIWRLYSFVKTKFPGFENSIITNIAQTTGKREERRVKTKYIYKNDDLINAKTFEHKVLAANYSIDVHGDKKNNSILKKTNKYYLPLESLMSADFDNLFVVGKIVGAEFFAHSALRVQKSCMSMAEGVANYLKTLK